MLGSCVFGVFFVFSLCSCFGPLGSVGAWVVTGDRAQLVLIVISGEFRAAVPELQLWIVSSLVEWYQDSDDVDVSPCFFELHLNP